MNAEDLDAIHAASLEILERVGVRADHEPMLRRAADFEGAIPDGSARTVRFSPDLVHWALDKAGKRFVHYGRDGELSAVFGEGKFVSLSIGGEFAIIEGRDQRREPTAEDVRRCIRLSDGLQEINIVGPMVIPREPGGVARDLWLHAELFSGTRKPVFTWTYSGEGARGAIKMAALVAGGAKRLAERPLLQGFIEPISPLTFPPHGLDILMAFCEAGLPVGFGPMAQTGSTAPGTLAGTIAQEHAEILAGIVFSQMLREGVPVLYWGIPHPVHLRTMGITFGAPEQGLMAAVHVALGKRFGLPVGVNIGLTDSKAPDAQAGYEKIATLLMGALAGCDICGHLGILGPDQGSSLAQLVIDNELCAYVRRVARGFRITPEHLATEVICRVGPGGNFLIEDVTLDHIREEVSVSSFADREQWETWVGSGALTAWDRAEAVVERILSEPGPDPLEPGLAAELEAMWRAYLPRE